MDDGAGVAAHKPVLGRPHTRVDGHAKVTGRADFPSDARPERTACAVLVTSPMARGRVLAIDHASAAAIPGVLDVLSHQTLADPIQRVGHLLSGGWANSTLPPLSTAEIAYAGQIVAVVVGDTLEAAREGALALKVRYAAEPCTVVLEDAEAGSRPLSELRESYHDRHCGDVEAALREGWARVEATYETPVQHHNPIELFTTTCVWRGEELTVYEPTRYVDGVKNGLAAQLALRPDQVRVVSHFIGGHFGSKFGLSQHTALIAVAARRVGRPVTLACSRRDTFTIATHRPETRHRIRIAAGRDGRLTALSHEATFTTSRFDLFAMEGTDVTTALYACPNVSTEERVTQVDRNTPGPMRAPPETPYLFALESAVDELARRLDMDPVELRRRNDTAKDPVTGEPFTTRPLLRCLEAGAKAFGWAERRAGQSEGDWRIGYGCASAARPVKIGPVTLRLAMTPNGQVSVQTAHHEIGNGLYTLLAMTAADRLGVPVEAVTVELGDTRLPPAGLSGGSSTSTSLVNALAQGCETLNRRRVGPGAHDQPIEVEVSFAPQGAAPDALAKLKDGHFELVTAPKGKLAWAFGAHFVEVRVHALTGEVRVARMVGAFAAGRILNPLAARSQLLGGMIWGLGSALLEATELDRRDGTYVNASLSEYLIPTCADTPDLTAITVEDDDREVNAEGIKGLGEIGIIGVNAAIANAVYDATGRRIRRLPIRPEDLL